jgi:hypothetical protein
VSNDNALSDPEEQLFRQVHPGFIRAGRPTSQAFQATKEHEYKLSVSQSSKTDPETAFHLHTRQNKLASAGVWAVTVAECGEVGLNAYSDPVLADPADPAHALIDYLPISSSAQRKAKAKLLARKAHERGCLYRETRGD